MSVLVEFDPEVPATYVRLRDDAVARTVEVMDAYCMVDLDAAGQPLGVEILSAPADISDPVFQALATTFPSLDIDVLRIALSGHPIAAA
jgi:uncharacterized protein YuzE